MSPGPGGNNKLIATKVNRQGVDLTQDGPGVHILVCRPALGDKLGGERLGLVPRQIPPEEQETKDLLVGDVRVLLAESAQLQTQHLIVTGQHLGQDGHRVKWRVKVRHFARNVFKEGLGLGRLPLHLGGGGLPLLLGDEGELPPEQIVL